MMTIPFNSSVWEQKVRDLVSSLNTYIEKYPPVIFQHRYFQHGSMGGKIGEQPTVVNALSCSQHPIYGCRTAMLPGAKHDAE